MHREVRQLVASRLKSRFWAFAAVLGLAVAAAPAEAGISFLDSFRSESSMQTADGASTTLSGYFFTTSLHSDNGGDYTGVSLAYPGPGSPVALVQQSDPTVWLYQTSLLPDQATMDAAFPTGTYTYTATNGATSDVASFDYTADDYPLSQPYLTGTSYSDLQNLNAASTVNLTFSAFNTGGNASDSFIFFQIYDLTLGAFAYDAGFLPSTATGVTVNANTLVAGHDYRYELIFSNRDQTASPGAGFNAQLGFENRTYGLFSTAAVSIGVPEPSTIVMLASGALVIGASRLRRKRAN